ncbi:MAG TPA: acyl-CoA dehydrogenase, partial [Gammaproteobacteria bacterium]|nr:acyl-CoA dehydrogenase [Gammaproteobacteria bacterium]
MSSALGITLPEEIVALQEGIEAFVKKEVISRHEKHHALLSDPRKKFTEDGRYAPEVVALIREIRMASAEAGYE